MQISGLKYGAQLLELVEFPYAPFLTADATKEEIQTLLDQHKKLVIKPFFSGGVGKKGKAGLVRIADNLQDALQAKKELYFATHLYGAKTVQASGVTYEAFIPSEIEVYFSITASTIHRKPIFTISPWGGIDIEALPPEKKKVTWIDPFIGLKSFDITNALVDTGCPEPYISPLVQNLPKLWGLYDNYGLTTLEINPIRMTYQDNRLVPMACDLKAAFDQDNPAWKRLGLPSTIFQSDITPFEAEINQLRTYQGQSDVLELNPAGTIIPFMYGGGANSAATETLGASAIFASDFGGNPPYEKMYEIARIVFKHWLKKANVLLIIGGKANNTDIYVTFKGIFDALRDHVALHGRHPIYTVVGRGGPNLIKGMFYGKDILDTLKLPYKMFGYDTSMIQVLEYAKRIDQWWAESGRKEYEKKKV
ncbi:MAG TPA: ATP citrate lyase citrate-binding domain-containing protein [bacterium]|nr:ATP citrate lyase citrate-binding domain-containing protein [bacterium]HQG46460.1 ATP citrate lyase citrate-binding domain-containing protein [bacterium]HQI47502.1 ATP citrate lyase citrate-binding domain-containing protein [bacterium]HQJ65768.1 ATP citrate lyase citrate-binding domain-containing protein [bacterium]